MEIETLAASDHLGRDGGRVCEAHPEDAASKVAAVAVDEFGGELGLADPAEACHPGDLYLPDGRGLPRFELAGQSAEVVFPADEERVDRKGHAGAGRKRRGLGDVFEG